MRSKGSGLFAAVWLVTLLSFLVLAARQLFGDLRADHTTGHPELETDAVGVEDAMAPFEEIPAGPGGEFFLETRGEAGNSAPRTRERSLES